MTKLEQAQGKLDRLRNEQNDIQKDIKQERGSIPFGQPNIIGRRDIYKRVNQLHEKQRKLHHEEIKQENRIEMLEKVEDFKEENELIKDVHVVGKTSYATVGAKTSVNNLDYFKMKLAELEQKNEEAKAYNKTKPAIKSRTYGTDITKLKRKIIFLEDMQEKSDNQILSEETQELIDSEKVRQWKKKPIYYFVTGLKKVALEIDEHGNFFESPRYPAYTENDQLFIKELLSK